MSIRKVRVMTNVNNIVKLIVVWDQLFAFLSIAYGLLKYVLDLLIILLETFIAIEI